MASTRKAVSGNVQRLKNAATVFGITQTPSSNVTSSLTIGNSAQRGGSKNGYPIVSTANGRKKALSSGGFSYFLANHYVVLSGNITIQLAGVSNTVMASASSFARRAIAYKLDARTTMVTGISWTNNSISGPRFTFTESDQNPNFGNDAGAVLSPTLRTKAFYMVTGKTASGTSYKQLTLW